MILNKFFTCLYLIAILVISGEASSSQVRIINDTGKILGVALSLSDTGSRVEQLETNTTKYIDIGNACISSIQQWTRVGTQVSNNQTIAGGWCGNKSIKFQLGSSGIMVKVDDSVCPMNPEGSYKNSCKDCQWDVSNTRKFKCTCQKRDQSWIPAEYDMTKCENLGNDDGRLGPDR